LNPREFARPSDVEASAAAVHIAFPAQSESG